MELEREKKKKNTPLRECSTSFLDYGDHDIRIQLEGVTSRLDVFFPCDLLAIRAVANHSCIR